MQKRFATVILVATMAVSGAGLVAGCGRAQPRAAAAAPAMNPESSELARRFYKAYVLGQDMGAAWDMAAPNAINFEMKYKNRTEFVQDMARSSTPQPDRPIEIKELKRVEDFVYLISDSRDRWLIWTTKDSTGKWVVRKVKPYDGGEIPW